MNDNTNKTAVYIEIGENLAEVFKEAIDESCQNDESIYNVVDVLSSRIESMAVTSVVNNGSKDTVAEPMGMGTGPR